MKIAVLSNYTADMLGWYNALTESDYEPEIKFGGYNQIVQDLFWEQSWMKEFNPDVIIIALSSAGEPIDMPAIEGGIMGLKKYTHAPVLLTLPETEEGTLFHPRDGLTGAYRIFMYDIVIRVGVENAYDQRLYYQAKFAFSRRVMEVLAEEIVHTLDTIYGNTKKVIVVDADNTLWGGVIGEDGVNGIDMSGPYNGVQTALLQWKERGVLLALCSKNNSEDVEPVWDHSDMVLRKEDFVTTRTNWKLKSENIHDIAKELNLDPSSFVFLDDNIAEQMEVSMGTPVTIAPFPKDICDLPTQIINWKYFPKFGLTEEDTKRTEMYHARKKREEEKVKYTNPEEYLKDLGMKIKVHKNNPAHLKRITQLVNKTNQFNLTTNRYTEEAIVDYMNDTNMDVYSLEVSDKHGPMGVTGVAIVKYGGNNIHHITDFLISCRVMGRGIEKQFLLEIMKDIISTDKEIHPEDYVCINGYYVSSGKNIPCAKFYTSTGKFAPTYLDGDTEESYAWEGHELDIEDVPYVEVLQ